MVLFSDPFYDNGPNDKGIGWNILNSLYRVGIGFGAAAVVGIPLGFLIGRFQFLNQMLSPIISILRPVSPLAWLPIGLLVRQRAEPASIWVILISSIWPMVLADGAEHRRRRAAYSTRLYERRACAQARRRPSEKSSASICRARASAYNWRTNRITTTCAARLWSFSTAVRCAPRRPPDPLPCPPSG